MYWFLTLTNAAAAPMTAATWQTMDDASRQKHVAKRVSHDYVRLGPPKQMDAIFTGEHRLRHLCVISAQTETLLEFKQLVGGGPSVDVYSVVSFSQEGLSAWSDRFHDGMVAALDSRPDLDVRGVQAVSALPSYTDRGKSESAGGGGWASDTRFWRTVAYDSQAIPVEANLITRVKWMSELAEGAGCDAFVHGFVRMAFTQGKKDTVEGVKGRWLDGTMSATFHTYVNRDFYLAAAEAGGHFTPPKIAPRVNPWVAIGDPKNSVAFRVFVGEGETPDAVLQSHYVAPMDEAFTTLAEMNRRALDLVYPPES